MFVEICRRAAVCLALVFVAAGGAFAASEKPNIVYIMADDLGVRDVTAYGATATKTPNVDRIAKEGIRFTDAHSETACCTPTRYGVLTGRYSWRGRLKTGVNPWAGALLIEEGRLTLPAMLKSAGYATAAVGKWHLGLGKPGETLDWSGDLKPGPLEVGFDSYFGMPGDNHGNPILVHNYRLVDPTDAARLRKFDDAALKRKKQESIGPQLTQKAVQFIEQHKDRPFFLYFTPCAIHTPYTPAKQFQGTSGSGPRGDFVHELDWSVGEVLAALDRLKLGENTLIFFASDNGGDTRESMKGFREFKTSVYEGGHRVPLVARWPGRIKPGTVCDETVCLSDMMATCAALLGKDLPNDAAEDSFSILPLLKGEKPATPLREAMINKACRGPNFSIRQGPWKLVMPRGFWATPEGLENLAARNLSGSGELYNLADDVGETNDLAAKHPEIVKRLTATMVKFVREGRSRPAK